MIELRKKLRGLGDDSWVKEKLIDLDEIVGACLGLHLAAVTEKPMAQPGEKLGSRSRRSIARRVDVKFKSIQIGTGSAAIARQNAFA